MSDSEMEDYGFEYSDEDDLAEDADLENDYYNSKGNLEQNQLDAALEGFQRILDSGDEHPSRDEWAFKALKQVAKIRARAVVGAVVSLSTENAHERQAAAVALSKASDDLLASYGQMLSLAQHGAVTMAVAEKKLGSLLDFLATTLSGGGGGGGAPAAAAEGDGTESHVRPGERVLERVYVATLESLTSSMSASSVAAGTSKAAERLAFRTRLRLASLWLDQRAHAKASELLDELLAETTAVASGGGGVGVGGGELPSSATPNNVVPGAATDARAGTALLDVLALQIRLRTERGDAARSLRPLHRAASEAVASAIPHPRVLGAVRECGGLVAMAGRDWESASTDFFDAFKSYDEAGASSARGRCLRRCALATMLLRSGVDPFEAQEARPFRSDPAVRGATELARAFERADALEFERVLADAKRKARDRARNRKMKVGAMEEPEDESTFVEDDSIGGDRLFDAHLPDLRALLRRAVVLRACEPYVRVRLSHLAAELGGGRGRQRDEEVEQDDGMRAALAEAEATVAALILDGELEGASIDQVAGTVELGTAGKKSGGAGGKGKEAGTKLGAVAGGAAAAAAATAAAKAVATAAAAAEEELPVEVRRSLAVRAWASRAREMGGLVVARMQAT